MPGNQLYPTSKKHILVCVDRFTHLSTIDCIAGTNWYDRPQACVDTTRPQYDKHLYWLERKDSPTTKSSPFWPFQDMDLRTKHRQHSVLALRLFLPLLSRRANNVHLLQRRQLCIDVTGSFLSSRGLRKTTVDRVSLSTALKYAQRVTNLEQLKVLHLHLLDGWWSEDNWAKMNMSVPLSKATFVKDLRVSARFETFAVVARDYAIMLCGVHLPSLKHLALSEMLTTSAPFRAILSAHPATLTSLTLAGICLTDGSWEDLLRSLPQLLKLSAFRAENLSWLRPFPPGESQRWPNMQKRDWYLQSKGCDAYRSLSGYVLHSGSWTRMEKVPQEAAQSAFFGW
jgi:hypothetical protein